MPQDASKDFVFDPDKFRIAAEFAPVHMIYTDADGVIVYANPAAQMITGYSRAEMIGRPLRQWGGEMSREFYERMWQTVSVEKKPFHGELQQARMNGDAYTAEIWMTPVIVDGAEPSGYVGVEMDVSDRKKLLGDMEESERRFRQLTENVKEVFYLTDPKTFEVFYMSPSFEVTWGILVKDVFANPKLWFEAIFEEDRGIVADSIKEVIEGRESVADFRIRRPDGAVRWVRGRSYPVFDEQKRPYRLAGFAEDVTLEMESRQKIRESETRYRSLFDNMQFGYARYQVVFEGSEPKDLISTEVNAAYETLTGLKGVIGKKISDIVPGIWTLAPDFLAYFARVAATGKPERLEINIAPLRAWFYISAYRTDAGEVVAVFDNITERKESEARVKELDVLKNKFIHIVSHQLRTPLSAVRWNLESLLSGEFTKLNPENVALVRVSYEATHEVIRRIGDLLTALDIETGTIVLAKEEEVELEGMVRGVLGEAAKRCELRSVTCQALPADAGLPLVRIDAMKFRVALSNVIDNAVQYSQEHGLVTVRVRKMEGVARIEVVDQGIGIPKAEQKGVFTRFFRGSNAAVKVQDASGLGLAIAKYYIEAHGGTMGFESEEGKGSTFWIDLPLGDKTSLPS